MVNSYTIHIFPNSLLIVYFLACADAGVDFAIDHKFSAEIVAFKQAFIERNFAPPILFRNITELEKGKPA